MVNQIMFKELFSKLLAVLLQWNCMRGPFQKFASNVDPLFTGVDSASIDFLDSARLDKVF